MVIEFLGDTMKSLLAAASASALLAFTAPAFAFDWSGFYAGVGVGYAMTEATGTSDLDPSIEFNMSPKGFFGGVDAGFNAELLMGLMLGVEGDVSLADITETIDDVTSPGDTITSTTDWTGTLRGRVGLAVGDFMPYLTAGVAVAHGVITGTDGDLEDDALLVGGIVGAGVEVAVMDNVTLKGEALYSVFGDHTWFEGETFQNTSSQTSGAVRGGANFHF
jgi:outer membrane immunogenic protein